MQPSSRSREFLDALMRANGAAPGVQTNAMQWGRWTP